MIVCSSIMTHVLRKNVFVDSSYAILLPNQYALSDWN